jgi:hypothetical protein
MGVILLHLIIDYLVIFQNHNPPSLSFFAPVFHLGDSARGYEGGKQNPGKKAAETDVEHLFSSRTNEFSVFVESVIETVFGANYESVRRRFDNEFTFAS